MDTRQGAVRSDEGPRWKNSYRDTLEQAWEIGVAEAVDAWRELTTPTDCVLYALVSILASQGIGMDVQDASARYADFIACLPTNADPNAVMKAFRARYGRFGLN